MNPNACDNPSPVPWPTPLVVKNGLNALSITSAVIPVPVSVTATLSGVSVFVAEDEPMLLWALEEVLAELGCKVVGTSTRVTDALAFVATHTFDVAVLDGKLSDGPIDRVVEVLVARGTPFILASGVASSECSARFGNVTSLQKPYNDADLQQALLLALAQGSV
jgi:CheY-like chemotaxis protein